MAGLLPDPEQQRYFEAWQAALVAARLHCDVFIEYVMLDERGQHVRIEDFHREWLSLIPPNGTPGKVQIIAPRDHAKTSIIIGWVLWSLGNDHNLRIKYVTADDDLAVNIAISIQNYIENSESLHEVFPDLLPDKQSGWSHGKLFVQRTAMSKDPSLEVTTIMSTGIGAHSDIIVFDDVVSFRNAIAQPKTREQVKRIFKEVWLNLVDEIRARVIYLATPWHEDDLTADVAKSGDWIRWRRAAILPNGRALWPSRWPIAALKRRRRLIGVTNFARQFLLRAISDEDKTFDVEALESVSIPPREVPGEVRTWLTFGGVDLAHSLKKSGKRSVIVTIAADPVTRLEIVVGVKLGKWRFETLLRNVVSEYRLWRWNMLYVENNAMQEAVVEQLPREDASIPVVGFTTGSNKLHPEYGLPGLGAVMNNHGILIPYDRTHEEMYPDGCPCGFCELHRELIGHPVAEYTDAVMALWFAHEAARFVMGEAGGGDAAEAIDVGDAGHAKFLEASY